MSWDVSLVDPVPLRDEVELGNYTWNCAPMLHEAGLPESLSSLRGWRAGDAAPLLESVMQAWNADPDRYRELNPSNGWGNFDRFRIWIGNILEACREHPNYTLWVT